MGSKKSHQALRRSTREFFPLAVGLVLFLAGSASAELGYGLYLGKNWVLRPRVGAGITYDTNAKLERSGKTREDVFTDTTVGASLLKAEDWLTFDLDAWYQLRRYDTFKELNEESWKENLQAVIGKRDSLQLTLSQNLASLTDYEFSFSGASYETVAAVKSTRLLEGRTRKTRRRLEDYGAQLARDVGRLQLDGSASYSSVAYNNNQITFNDIGLTDWDEIAAAGTAGLKISGKSSAFLTGEWGNQTTRNGLGDNSTFGKLRVGLRTDRSAKLTLSASGGYEQYAADSVAQRDASRGIFHYQGVGAWQVSKRVRVQFFGSNEITPSSIDYANTKRVDELGASFTLRLMRRLAMDLSGSVRMDDYTAPLQASDGNITANAEETLAAGRLSVEYVPARKFFNVRLTVRHEMLDSNFQPNYAQTRVSLAGQFVY